MNSYRPKVSCILPIYKVEKYLKRCVDSVVNQTFKDIEIILVDDGSPDGCGALCDEYAKKDHRIKVIHKENGGLGYARNSGLEIAVGDYVAFIDSDDYVDSDMVEKLYLECTEKSLDAIFADFYVEGNCGFTKNPPFQKLYDTAQEIGNFCLDLIGSEPSCPSCSKMQVSVWRGLYSLSLIKKFNIKFPSEREFISEDIVFNLDFLKQASKIEVVPSKFYHYCFNDVSLSNSYRPDRWKKLLGMLDVMAEKGHGLKRNQELKLRLGRTALAYSKIAIHEELSRKKPFFNQIRAIVEILESEKFNYYFHDYPIAFLPIRWKVYAYLVKHKSCFFIYLMLK